MTQSLITIAYIAASALFILSLGGLSRQETARRGNWYGIIGMLIALVATAAAMSTGGLPVLIAALVPGLIIGGILASRRTRTAHDRNICRGVYRLDHIHGLCYRILETKRLYRRQAYAASRAAFDQSFDAARDDRARGVVLYAAWYRR